MAKIAIEIDCGLETYENCRFIAGQATGSAICGFFRNSKSELVKTPGQRAWFRLPECIAAEVSDE